MSKAHRGKPLREETPNSGRGKDPISGRTGVKLVYEVEVDGKKMMVSKMTKAMLANKKKAAEKAQEKATG